MVRCYRTPLVGSEAGRIPRRPIFISIDDIDSNFEIMDGAPEPIRPIEPTGPVQRSYIKGTSPPCPPRAFEWLAGRRAIEWQIHNEMMITECDDNSYPEYLLLFKYAIYADIDNIYVPYIANGYLILKS